MKAVAYYRTSSATNVGVDKDSEVRQATACAAYAERQNIQIVGSYYDAAVRGSDTLADRPGFSKMLHDMQENDISLLLIETASRFARDVVIQITGYEMLLNLGITMVPVDCPWHFQDDTPTAKLIRTVLAAVAEFEKDMLVEKMKVARERKRQNTGRCEGRRPPPPDAVAAAVDLRSKGMSYHKVGEEMAKLGFRVTRKDGAVHGPYKAQSVRLMVKGNYA